MANWGSGHFCGGVRWGGRPPGTGRCRELSGPEVDQWQFNVLTATLTVYALFGPDVRMCLLGTL